MLTRIYAFGLLLLASCTPISEAGDGDDLDARPSPAPDAGTGADAAGGADADPPVVIPEGAVELVSPNVCDLINGRLRHCNFGPIEITAPAEAPGAGPVKSVLSFGKHGNCSTQFRVEVSLDTPETEPSVFYPVYDVAHELRTEDGGPVSAMTLGDASLFAGNPIYDDSCRMWLEVAWNVPDAP